jgi:protein SCO1/2
MKTPFGYFAVLFVAGVLALPVPARAQWSVGNYGRVPDTGMAAGRQVPQDKVLSSVHWEQKLQNPLPLDAQFKDESSKDVKFGQYFDGKRPVVLAMIFYNCTMLCSEVLNGTMKALHGANLTPGKDFDVVVVSINPKEDSTLARSKKKNYLAEYKFSKDAAGFHFLTGSKENIDKVTNAAGYFYSYDPKTEQYAHPGGVVVVTPQGKVARYFTGVLYEPRDLRLSLVEASQGKVGTVRDLILLRCFHYDDTTGKYSLAIMEVLRAVAAGFVIIVGLSLALWVRRDLKKEKQGARDEARGASTPASNLEPHASNLN